MKKPYGDDDKETGCLLSPKQGHAWDCTIPLSFNTAGMGLPICSVLQLTHPPVPPAELGKGVPILTHSPAPPGPGMFTKKT